MQELIAKVEEKYKKSRVVDVQSGDIVRVHQKIREGSKTRTQVFEGMVIRVDRNKSLSNRITVRRIASGVGVEKSFLLHSPLIEKVVVVKRSNVRRNYLSYMRDRAGKSARLAGVEFDKNDVNIPIEQQQAMAEAEQLQQSSNIESTDITVEKTVKAESKENVETKKNTDKVEDSGEDKQKPTTSNKPDIQKKDDGSKNDTK